MTRALIAGTLCWLMLTADMCVTTSDPTATVTCLPMATYSATQEKAAGDALAALDAASPLIGMMTDYAALRAADRACQAAGH